MRLVKASEIQEMDRKTIQELGIPGVVLMENAGRGASRAFLEHFLPEPEATVAIVCGRGNNGGDGYVVARYLHNAGLKPVVIILANKGDIRGDALVNLKVIQAMGLKIMETPELESWQKVREILNKAQYVVDAILGTGINSPVREFYAKVIEEINTLGKPVMAIDIPSGLNADTGAIMGVAVRADLTVTFGFPKVGTFIFPGASFAGRIVRIDISIPEQVSSQVQSFARLTEPHHIMDALLPPKPDIHKGHRGHLLILAGSPGKTGAACLAALGALRAGAGLVTVGVPANLNPIIEAKLTEAMSIPLPETQEGTLSLAVLDMMPELLEGKTALALGPGLTTNPQTAKLVREILTYCPIPMVIDADGVNALAGHSQLINGAKAPVVLTPHPGEMARLIDSTSAHVQSDRIGTATSFVQSHPCCLVLKGARTLIVTRDGQLWINPTGNPALASGGSGDVLTGLVGGFLARRISPELSAISGVYIHGLAADFLAQEMGEAGLMAGELLEVIPHLTLSLSQDQWPLREPPLHGDLYQPL